MKQKEQTMGDVINVDFRNKKVRIRTDEREVSTEIVFDPGDSGNCWVIVTDHKGELMKMRVEHPDGALVMYRTHGSPLWLGLALRAYSRIWPGGDEIFGAFYANGYGDALAVESVGFVERDGGFYRDADEEWPQGMVEEALMTENAMKEEGLPV